ncbi:sugar phosphate isomerase/epimerase family protein [Microbacterium sp. X-17]|uniref:sugar phosphate isomerase/epimerase family protein n=1 Tax=Microbacterium sp. X-17 TaxID=3144404 RepID=UPI0031F58D90
MTITVPPEIAKQIRFAAHAISWTIPMGDAIPGWLDEVVEAGYDGVAVFGFQIKDFIDRPDDFGRLLDARGLQLAAVTGLLDDTQEWAEKLMDFMSALGAEHLACTDFDTTLTIPKAIEILDERAGVGDSRGLKVYYHNHTGGVGETMAQVEAIFDGIEPAHRHVMLDVGHATKDFPELPPAERALDFLTRRWGTLEYLEFKDFNDETDLNTPLGEGYADWDGIAQLIAGGGYEGWIVIEQNGNLGPSRGRTPLECATISRDFVRRYGL